MLIKDMRAVFHLPESQQIYVKGKFNHEGAIVFESHELALQWYREQRAKGPIMHQQNRIWLKFDRIAEVKYSEFLMCKMREKMQDAGTPSADLKQDRISLVIYCKGIPAVTFKRSGPMRLRGWPSNVDYDALAVAVAAILRL
eukprot:3195861-Amphidinium_carterae.1